MRSLRLTSRSGCSVPTTFGGGRELAGPPGVRVERRLQAVAVGGQDAKFGQTARQRFAQWGANRPLDQAGAWHQGAPDRVFEVAHLVAVGRPVDRVRPRHAEQSGGVFFGPSGFRHVRPLASPPGWQLE